MLEPFAVNCPFCGTEVAVIDDEFFCPDCWAETEDGEWIATDSEITWPAQSPSKRTGSKAKQG
jgi:endogenous inhibitor of DNA gyrase (YacG/DUF329 family)